MKDKNGNRRIIADNRKGRHNFEIEDVLEAGIVLTGSEVKSLRRGRATIGESYASPEEGAIWLINAYIPEYLQANRNNHEPRRPRKLLLHSAQYNKLSAAVERGGMTMIPLKLYFNNRGMVKLELAVAKGRKLHDKRQMIKEREWGRQKQRLLKRSY